MKKETASRKRSIHPRRLLALADRHRLPLIILSVAFLVRFIYLVAASKSPFFQVHVADALYHEQWARRILDGDIFSLKMQGVLYKAPLYPYFLALGYLFSGKSNFSPMFLQVVLSASSCLLLFLIGKSFFGARAAFIGALVYAFYFPSIYFSTEMEIPTVAIFLTLLSFYLLLEGSRILSLVGSAIVFGLSLLALPTNILLLPLYVLVLLKRQGGTRRRVSNAVLYASIVLATILPCTLRNVIAGNHPTLISANGGINLYIGNNERYDETATLQPGYAFEEFYDEPRRVAGLASFADRDAYWYKKARDFIAKHPGQEATLLLKKLVLYFADYEIYRNTDSYYAKDHSIYRNIPFVPSSWILAAGLIGLIVAIHARRHLELGAFCILQALPCLVFFVVDRYRLPSMGVWAVFSGFFVTFVADAVKGRAWRPGIAALAGAVCVAIVSNLNLFVVKNPEYRPHLNLGFIYETQTKYHRALAEYSTALHFVQKTAPRDIRTESELYARIGNVHMMSGELEAARKSFEHAVAVQPNSGPAYSYLGTLYDKEKRRDLAVKMFTRAIEINPWDVVSIHNLGLCYLNSERLDEAIVQFKRAIELAPELSGAHSDLAYAYGKQGKYDQMEVEAKKAIYYHPEGSAARYNLALLYLNTGRIDEAIAQYRAIVQMAPRDSGNAYNQLGVIFAQRSELRQAVDNWQKALEVDPNNMNARVNLQRARNMMR
ncbi:MAG: tetratricopeptide repeat protein [Polyangiaceae bacterium]|nr:tetratricopeptide repeat protein [Polyangiaceae bacterium]